MTFFFRKELLSLPDLQLKLKVNSFVQYLFSLVTWILPVQKEIYFSAVSTGDFGYELMHI